MPKEKLTLSVDKEVVKKAKKLGINISEITEKVLKGFTFTVTNTEESQLRAKYKELFDTMLPLLRKYNTAIEVASLELATDKDLARGISCTSPITLLPSGKLWSNDLESEAPLENIPLDAFDSPQSILSKFVDAISRGSERMKEHLKELEMAKRIVKAIVQSMEKPSVR